MPFLSLQDVLGAIHRTVGKWWVVMPLAGLSAAGKASDTMQDVMTVYGENIPADAIDVGGLTQFASVIDVADVPASMATVADVLERQVGVQVRSTGGLGAFASVYIRGASAQQVNVYLDGVLLNNLASGSVDLSRIALAEVATIEIYRGSTPAQLGQSAVGGAIHIRTKVPHSGRSGQFRAGIGSFGTQTMDAAMNLLPTERAGVLASLGYQASDNDFTFTYDNRTPLNPYDDETQKRHHNAVRMLNGLLSTRFRLTPHSEIVVTGQHHRKQQDIPDLFNSEAIDTGLDTIYSQIQLQLNQGQWVGGSYSASVFWGQLSERYFDRQGRVGLGQQDERSDTDTFGADWVGLRSFGMHDVTLRGAWRSDRFRNQQRIGSVPDQSLSRDTLNLAVQEEWSPNARWSLMMAMNTEWIRDEAEQSVLGTRQHETDETFHVTGQLGVSYLLLEPLRWKANLNRSVRVPRVNEKFGDRGLFVGNPDLVEEKAVNLDMGWQWDDVDRSVTVAGFARWLRDAIVATYDARGVGRFENISQAQIVGVELATNWELLPWLAASWQSTWQHTENTSEISDQKGKPLAGHYEQAHSASLTASWPSWSTRVSAHLERGGYYDSAQSTPIGDKRLLDWTASWQPESRNARLELSVRNLLDHEHEAYNGYPAPGRSVFVSWEQRLP